jgi:hypothetical protein
MVRRQKMKSSMLDNLPKHNCAKPGNPFLGFATLDFDAMKQLVERNASREEIGAQVNTSIAADAAKNPNPTEPEAERFRDALLANVPFAIYCGACLTMISVINPKQVEQGDIVNANKDDLTPMASDEAITKRVHELRAELENLGRWGIVTWCDDDIVEALENAGVDPSTANIKSVREHFYVEQIDDRMTEVGWEVLAEAIGVLGLPTNSDADGEASGAKTRD